VKENKRKNQKKRLKKNQNNKNNQEKMNTFTNQINESAKPLPKFNDRTKQDIYALIKENVKASIDTPEDKTSQDGDVNVSIGGVDELTDKLYNYIQREKTKGEINVLESIKSLLVSGPFNLIKLNNKIDELKKQL